MKKSVLSLLALASSFAVTATENDVTETVATPETKAYVAGFIGQSSFDVDKDEYGIGSSTKIDDSDSAYKLVVGYHFTPHFAVETGYVNLGEVGISARESYADDYYQYSHNVSAGIEVSGAIINLVAALPINEQARVYAKLGAFSWNAKAKVKSTFNQVIDGQSFVDKGSDSEKADGTDTFYGAGIEYRFDNVSVRGEYELFESEGENINVLSLGVSYHF